MIKGRILSLICITFLSLALHGASHVTLNGVRYVSISKTEASASVDKSQRATLKHLDIPESVKIDGQEYLVTKITKGGFEDCPLLESVVLPNSIKIIEEYAFWKNPNLRSVIMPDEAKVQIAKGAYGFDKGGIFKGCTNLEQARGITVMYPHYLVFEAIDQCEEVPFAQIVKKTGAIEMTKVKMPSSFSTFVLERVKRPIEVWQSKKDYETSAQWGKRVTQENRKKMLDEAVIAARADYIKIFAPGSIFATLQDYNEEFGFFPCETTRYGTLYASVPASEAQNFASNWGKVIIKPVFGILDDGLAVIDCAFELGSKSYPSARKYEEDNYENAAAYALVPLEALREYDQLANTSGEDIKNSRPAYSPDIVDLDIPVSVAGTNDKTFAVIIGNENYQRVSPVDYAMNDARIFAKYCSKTLGIPENNIRTYYDATYGDMVAAMQDLKDICETFKGEAKVIFYYAGHGVPDESTRQAFLIPVDAMGQQTAVCYPLSQLYKELSALPSTGTIAFIDACFSGSLRGEGMLASARGIKLHPRDASVNGNLIVLSAASADQTAMPFPEKSHGLYTYFLLKHLHDTQGDTDMGTLTDYVIENVSKESLVTMKHLQKPVIKFPTTLSESWRGVSLKN